MWLTGLVALRHVGSSQTRAQTRVPCIGRQILNHCATREAPHSLIYLFFPAFSKSFIHESIPTELSMCMRSFGRIKRWRRCCCCHHEMYSLSAKDTNARARVLQFQPTCILASEAPISIGYGFTTVLSSLSDFAHQLSFFL